MTLLPTTNSIDAGTKRLTPSNPLCRIYIKNALRASVYVCACVCVLYVRVTTLCQCGLNLQAYWICLQQLGTSIHGYQKLV